jgi:hypothetical protein
MKDMDIELQKEIDAFFNSMSDREFQNSLKRAKFDFYKNIKTPIFRDQADPDFTEVDTSGAIYMNIPWHSEVKLEMKHILVTYWADLDRLFSDQCDCFERAYLSRTDEVEYSLAA